MQCSGLLKGAQRDSSGARAEAIPSPTTFHAQRSDEVRPPARIDGWHSLRPCLVRLVDAGGWNYHTGACRRDQRRIVTMSMGLRSAIEATARSLVPKSVRPICLDLYYLAIDGARGVFVRQDPLVPPKRLLRISTDPHRDFRQSGLALLHFLVEHCALRPDHSVLDVGCGVGRVAVALTGYLGALGRYQGVDVVPQEIAWCQEHIASRFPNFNFQLANVHNSTYNPAGQTPASEHRFPFDDRSFDLVVLASVFTHMLGDDVEHYLDEMGRLLKCGGRGFLSFYLLNEESRARIDAGKSLFDFSYELGSCRVQSAVNPELAVAHDEGRVKRMLQRCHLSIDNVLYGTWSSRQTQEQDLIIVSRER